LKEIVLENERFTNTGISKMNNGKYKTEAGSTVIISGKYSGVSEIEFDWYEEKACADCKPEPYPEEFNPDDWRLVWYCDFCNGGNAKLKETKL